MPIGWEPVSKKVFKLHPLCKFVVWYYWKDKHLVATCARVCVSMYIYEEVMGGGGEDTEGHSNIISLVHYNQIMQIQLKVIGEIFFFR